MSLSFVVASQVDPSAEMIGFPVRPAEPGFVLPAGALPAGMDFDLSVLADRGFAAKVGETLVVRAPGAGTTILVAVGVGPLSSQSPETFRRAAAALVRVAGTRSRVVTTLMAAEHEGLGSGSPGSQFSARALAEGAVLATYRFDRYKSKPVARSIEELQVVAQPGVAPADLAEPLARGRAMASAMCLARDLINEPAATMTPRRLVEVATEVAARGGLQIDVWDENRIMAERLGGLAGVALGSDEPARLIRLTYDPPGATRTLALVGKGITFDSGGLSIKTADGMETMKTDMSGAAAVLGAMSVLGELGARSRVVGFIPATENMPGGRAMKPGDVLTIRNGTTVEVLNTDAEGRLVLADGLSLAVEERVDAVLDVATLTGACVIALGRKVAGLMANDDRWRSEVAEAARRAGEAVWPLPLPEDYRPLIDSEIADIKNIGGRYAGAITAGLFLREFVGDVPWAHLDIAGPARSDEDSGYHTKGGTGFAARTLVETALAFEVDCPDDSSNSSPNP
ncbi:MAG: leucyl aminopeptidase [Acidimicrobiales bacterium]